MRHKSVALRADGAIERIKLGWDISVAIGYAGRNQKAVMEHVEELRKIGVPAPAKVPSMYWIDPTRISSDEMLYVVGNGCSGEVEFFAARDCNNDLYITIASDHTDRALESNSVAKAKQCCSKIIGNAFWKMSDVRAHWDSIMLRSWVKETAKSEERLYQEAPVASLLAPEKLYELAREDAPFDGKISYFSGTVKTIGEICYGEFFRMELCDPVLNRRIGHSYTVRVLPDRN